jgi:hypothetical protein
MLDETMKPRELLNHQLNRVAARAENNSTGWTIFSIFGAGQAVLINAFGDASMRIGIAAAGMLTAVIWASLQFRHLAYLALFDEVIERLEEALGIPEELSVTNRNRFGRAKVNEAFPFSSRTTLKAGPSIAALGWLLAFVYALTAVP